MKRLQLHPAVQLAPYRFHVPDPRNSVFVLFDGLVSCPRSHSPHELLQLAREADIRDFAWEAGTLTTGTPLPMTYLVGYPMEPSARSAA